MGMAMSFARRLVKEAAAGVAHYSGLRKAVAAWRRRQSGGCRILMLSYHRVVADFTGELQRSIPGLLISQETFRKHLLEARAAGYELVSLEHALDVMAGRKTSKKDLCVITFDDGYRDIYRYAYPVLKELGVPSTMYLPAAMIGTNRRFNHDRLFHLIGVLRSRKHRVMYESLPPAAAVLLDPILSGQKTPSASLDDFIGEYRTEILTEVIDALERQLGGGPELVPVQGELCTWDEIREMGANGMEFGAHTLGHVVLTLEDPESLEREVRESQAWLERELGKPVRDFAYCNGWYSDEVIRVLVKYGFRSAVTTEDMPNLIGGDPFTLKRKVLWENFSVGVRSYSPVLTGCHLDDVFGALGAAKPVLGRRPQRPVDWDTANFFARERTLMEER
jgi:peptidoglycan/xylan/chitin deacetylase (PgdA/CDA1 family)